MTTMNNETYKATGFGPASFGNTSVAFDVMGVGLAAPGDTVIAKRDDSLTAGTVKIEGISGDGGKLSTNSAENTASVAAHKLLISCGAKFGVRLSIKKGLPLGSGLGSSAASATAALVAVNELLPKKLTKEQMIPFAIEAERVACGAAHGDNVAPSLLGGLVMIASYEPLAIFKIPVALDFWVCCVTPEIEVPTSKARAVLPKDVPLKTASKQLGLLGGSLLGFLTGKPELIRSHLYDLLVDPYREQFIPGYKNHKQAALDSGALAFGIGGAGPTVFLISSDSNIANLAGDAVVESFSRKDIASKAYTSPLNNDGARVVGVN